MVESTANDQQEGLVAIWKGNKTGNLGHDEEVRRARVILIIIIELIG